MSRIIILQLIIVQATSENIVVTPNVPEVNQMATISCLVPAPRYWYLPVGLINCNDVECNPDAYGSYTFRADPNKTEFILQSLNRTRDERMWTCQHENTSYTISLRIYTIPQGLELTADINGDLSMMSTNIQCRTTSCAYPEPSIEWLYKDQHMSNMYAMYNRSIPSSAKEPCIFPEKMYTSSINLSQYTTWSDNSDKTVTFFCRIGYPDPSKNITSLASKTVSFAVRVTEAFLQQNNQNITSNLIVNSGEQVTLTCVTGTSRPAPSIGWFIGSRSMGSGTNLIFTPNNTNHNEVIFCQAYNIDPKLKVDSNKPSLFVRVRVTEAFIQQNNQNITSTMTVTSGEEVTLTCVTGTSRPAPVIDWYIGSKLIGNGANLIFTPNNTDHNKVIYCQAYNINPSPKVDSNKPQLFVRVDVSSVILDGSAGGMIVFNESYPQTLKCISTPSRPMPIIRWLLGNKQVTDNITISDLIDTNELHVLTSEIKLVLMRNSSNQKVYCEGFISGQEMTAMSTQVSVDVWYAPDVRVNISGFTVVGSTAVLMCVTQGNPPQYTFHPWIHMVGQTEIRRLDGKNTFNFSTLSLSNISIQDMGTYICTVDNAITGLDGQVNQMDDTNVYIQGVPFVGETQSTFIGETNNLAFIEIPFYSYVSIKTVKFIKQLDSLEILNTSEISSYISPSNITMVFYNKKVMIPGHVAVLHFRNLKDTDFDNYTLQISNYLGTVSMQFDFIASAPPSVPKTFFFSHTEGSFLVFVIEKGFNGGHEQMFNVQYQPFGMPEAAWSTIFKINENDLDDPFSNGTYYIKIPKLQDGQYIFRVYAENKKGNTSIIGGVHVEIQTELLSVREVPVGAVVGGVIGAVVVVIVIVAVVFVVKRRNLKPKMEDFKGEEIDSADGKHKESGLKDNPVYDSSESGPVVQEYAAVVKPKKMFGHAEDSSKLYAQVEKTNKNKRKTASKGKQAKTPKGDVYENTNLPLKSSTENVYENRRQVRTEPNSSENVYENPDASASKGQLIYKDGLLYADLKLGPPTVKAGKPVIHGLEDRTEYAVIAYGKRGEPLPESDQEKESGGTKKKNGIKLNTDE